MINEKIKAELCRDEELINLIPSVGDYMDKNINPVIIDNTKGIIKVIIKAIKAELSSSTGTCCYTAEYTDKHVKLAPFIDDVVYTLFSNQGWDIKYQTKEKSPTYCATEFVLLEKFDESEFIKRFDRSVF